MFGKPFGVRTGILAGVIGICTDNRLCGNPGAEKGCSIGMGDVVENRADGTDTSYGRRKKARLAVRAC